MNTPYDDVLPPATAAAFCRVVETMLAGKYPGTTWTAAYDPTSTSASRPTPDAQEPAAPGKDDRLSQRSA